MAGFKKKMTTAAVDEREFDLAKVKQITQKVKSFGFDNAELPIFQWRLEINKSNLCRSNYSSEYFPINNSDLIGRLILYDEKLALFLTDPKPGETVNKLNPFQFFICQLKAFYRDPTSNDILEKCFFSMNAFSPCAENSKKYIFKRYKNYEPRIVIELYQEPLATIEYRSPYMNMVVGKIEKFKEIMEGAIDSEFLSVSSRFNCGSPEQLMFVKFWCSKVESHSDVTKLSLALCIRNHLGEPRGLPFAFTLTITIFSQKKNAKDLVYTVFYHQNENKSEYPTILAYHHELESYLENDIMYYKVVVDPHHTK